MIQLLYLYQKIDPLKIFQKSSVKQYLKDKRDLSILVFQTVQGNTNLILQRLSEIDGNVYQKYGKAKNKISIIRVSNSKFAGDLNLLNTAKVLK